MTRHKTSLLFLVILMTLSFSLPAQNPEIHENSFIHQIQLAAYEGEVDWERFKDLQDIGLVSTQSIDSDPDAFEKKDNYIRVFVGKYIGKKTVNAVKKLLKKKGFTDTKIETDSYHLNHSTGKNLRYTVQLGAFKKLNLEKFTEISQIEYLHILYQDGSFRVLYGFYPNEQMAESALKLLEDQGFSGIVKTFR